VQLVNGPTAAGANVGGRVTDADGRPVVMARVMLTDARGVSRLALTSPFGYYNFTEVQTGESVVITISDKRLVFASRLVEVSNDLSNVDLVGVPIEE
jgi:hypothetical protein